MATDQLIQTTPEDLLTAQDGDHFELVDGRLVEKQMSMEAVWVAAQIVHWLTQYGARGTIGLAFGDGATYQCFSFDANLVRRPDVSFILRGRLTSEQFSNGHCRVAPDLAVEVVSPTNRYFEVEQRVHDFLEAGTPLVWVVSPENRFVRIHRIDGTIADVRETGTLTGENVLPGFECQLADILPPRDTSKLL